MKYLLIGYGNPMRSDDGVGCHVAGQIREDATALMGALADDLHVVSVAQLGPELTELVGQCKRIVLINAAYGDLPGEFSVRRIEPATETTEPVRYIYDPATWAAWAGGQNGNDPEIYVLAVGASNCAVGEGLSPAVAEALPAVLEKVAELFLAA